MSELRLREQVLRHDVREMMAPANIGTLFNKERRQTPSLVELVGFGMRVLLALPTNKARLAEKTFASPESSGASQDDKARSFQSAEPLWTAAIKAHPLDSRLSRTVVRSRVKRNEATSSVAFTAVLASALLAMVGVGYAQEVLEVPTTWLRRPSSGRRSTRNQ